MHPQLHAQISGFCVRVPWNGRISAMGTKKTVEFEVGRDAGDGRFITVEEAKRRKKTAIVEAITRPSNTHKPPKRK